MSCLLCNEPFDNPITLNCGHTFDKMCLRQDFLNRQELLEPCVCPVCLNPYNYSLLINVYVPNTKEQRERIFKIKDWVKKTARDLDRLYQREHAPNEYTVNPTKESINEATLMGKQLIKQQAQQKEEKQKALIKQQQNQNEILMRQQIESDILIQQQKTVIQELLREREQLREQYYNTFQKPKGKNSNRLIF